MKEVNRRKETPATFEQGVQGEMPNLLTLLSGGYLTVQYSSYLTPSADAAWDARAFSAFSFFIYWYWVHLLCIVMATLTSWKINPRSALTRDCAVWSDLSLLANMATAIERERNWNFKMLFNWRNRKISTILRSVKVLSRTSFILISSQLWPILFWLLAIFRY